MKVSLVLIEEDFPIPPIGFEVDHMPQRGDTVEFKDAHDKLVTGRVEKYHWHFSENYIGVVIGLKRLE